MHGARILARAGRRHHNPGEPARWFDGGLLNAAYRRATTLYARGLSLIATVVLIAALAEVVVALVVAPPAQANIGAGVAIVAVLEASISRILARQVSRDRISGLLTALSMILATILLLASVGAITLVAFGIAEDT